MSMPSFPNASIFVVFAHLMTTQRDFVYIGSRSGFLPTAGLAEPGDCAEDLITAVGQAMATKAAGKGHDSWIRFPGLSMVLQGLVVELVCSPGYHVYLAASGVYHSEWAATEAGKTATLRTVIICATLTYFARAFTRVRTKWLLDAVWFVTPAAAAIAAWGQGAAFPVATWLVLRQAWMILASSLKSSGHTAPLTLTDSAKRLALPPSRILIAADAVPPKVRCSNAQTNLQLGLCGLRVPRSSHRPVRPGHTDEAAKGIAIITPQAVARSHTPSEDVL